MANPYREIPSVNDLVETDTLRALTQRVPRPIVVDAARRVLDEHRSKIVNSSDGKIDTPTPEEFARRIEREVVSDSRPPLSSVINATGIIIHTGLGRAPLADEAVDALADVASHYAPVELDLETGERGRRTEIVRDLLCELTGAESATVVNNNAGALVIILNTIAKDREVIVSRGELIEIGGSFRLPEIMAASGARLHEVGTTNRTRIDDYGKAATTETAAFLKIHASNYRIEGFTETPTIGDLVALSRRLKALHIPVIHDIGSGALRDLSKWGIAGEPDARSSIEAGADLVLFSGDKLLGGPQAGVIVGRADLMTLIEKNPMMRAMRVDKLILAALGVTLQLHRDGDEAAKRVPVLNMLTAPVEELEKRANQIADRLRDLDALDDVEVVATRSYSGGGALPAQAIASVGVSIRAASIDENELAKRLRTGDPPVVARIHEGSVILDMRTIFVEQDGKVVEAVRRALSNRADIDSDQLDVK